MVISLHKREQSLNGLGMDNDWRGADAPTLANTAAAGSAVKATPVTAASGGTGRKLQGFFDFIGEHPCSM